MIEFRLQDGGQLPSKGSEGAAGFDIKSNMVEYIAPNERKLLSTGVYLNRLPNDTYLRVAPRSKLANKHGINVLAGVVDSDYRGEIKVILHNTSNETFIVREGHAIAQLIPEKTTPCYVVDVTDEVVYSETARGDSGIDSEEERR